MNDILVFGKGWIGNKLTATLGCASTDKHIATYEDVQGEIDKFKPKCIINCIGHYIDNVDNCEKDKTKTLVAHTVVPLLLAEAAIRNGIKLVHISSGCLYNYDYKSNIPITEDQPPDFFDLYFSRAKIYTEAALLTLHKSANILQLRIRMPLDYIPHQKNLLTKLLNFNKVIDIPNSVTYLPDFLLATKHLLSKDAEGIYNIVNYGGLKFKELLEEYRKFDMTHNYAIASLEEIKVVRTNLILSTDKLEETGFMIRDIHEVLPECVEKYYQYVKGNRGK